MFLQSRGNLSALTCKLSQWKITIKIEIYRSKHEEKILTNQNNLNKWANSNKISSLNWNYPILLLYQIASEKIFKSNWTLINPLINTLILCWCRILLSSIVVCTKMTKVRGFETMLTFANASSSITWTKRTNANQFFVYFNVLRLDKCSFIKYLVYLHTLKQNDLFWPNAYLQFIGSCQVNKMKQNIVKTVHKLWNINVTL